MRFWKFQGLGNDYVLLDATRQAVEVDGEAVRRICARRFGVGADGLLVVERSSVADFRMRIFNADGTEAEMCGNGIRCVAKYVYEHGLTEKTKLSIETLAGVKRLVLTVNGGKAVRIGVYMGSPQLKRGRIPMLGPPEETCVEEAVEVDGEKLKITCVSMGNPHAIVFVDKIKKADVIRIGRRLERHKLFPKGTNVEFLRTISPTSAEMQVWERGVGYTLACGTGACAAAVAGAITGRLRVGENLVIHMPGGTLTIRVEENLQDIYMEGPVEEVFEGVLGVAVLKGP